MHTFLLARSSGNVVINLTVSITRLLFKLTSMYLIGKNIQKHKKKKKTTTLLALRSSDTSVTFKLLKRTERRNQFLLWIFTEKIQRI